LWRPRFGAWNHRWETFWRLLRRIIRRSERNSCCFEARDFWILQGEEMRRSLPSILLLALALGLAGCNDSNTTTPTPPPTPTPPSTPTKTEPFSGTLNRNGGVTFPFTATAGGTVTVTLSSLSPDSTLQIGLSLGSWTGSACQIVIANDAAAQSAVVTGTVTSAPSLCARVYDAAAKVATSVDFSISVAHP